jgi:hypothetical protein
MTSSPPNHLLHISSVKARAPQDTNTRHNGSFQEMDFWFKRIICILFPHSSSREKAIYEIIFILLSSATSWIRNLPLDTQPTIEYSLSNGKHIIIGYLERSSVRILISDIESPIDHPSNDFSPIGFR